MTTIRRSARWIRRNPNTTGLILVAWGAGMTTYSETLPPEFGGPLAMGAMIGIGIGRAIVIAKEIEQQGHDS